jgi:hypothetical protein
MQTLTDALRRHPASTPTPSRIEAETRGWFRILPVSSDEAARCGILPDVPRFRREIDPDLRATINAVITGQGLWPLTLLGAVGGGKTRAALCLADGVVGTGWRATYHTVGTLCEDRIAAQQGRLVWGDSEISEWGFWARWRESILTILDELGTQGRVSDFARQTVQQAIDAREGKPCVFISNMGLDQLSRLYDDRIASRLAAGTVYELTGPDRRVLRERA